MKLPAALAVAWLAAAAILPGVSQTPDEAIAFTGARVIDGTFRPPINDATIVVADGRIALVAPSSELKLPRRMPRVSLQGKVVIPGLVNAHGHVGAAVGLRSAPPTAATVERDLRRYAEYGVTSVFSLGDDTLASFAARARQRTAGLNRTRLAVAGPVVTAATPGEARQQVATNAAMKVDIIKIRVDDDLGTTKKMPPDVYRTVIEEAHRRGLRVAVHIVSLADAKAVIDAGAEIIAHSVRDSDVDDELITMMKQRRVWYLPTLTREFSTFVYATKPAFFSDPFFVKYSDRETARALEDPAYAQAIRASAAADRDKAGLDVARRNLRRLAGAGVRVAMGTDSGGPGRFPGYFEHLELEMMVQAGLSSAQALATATREAARCMALDEDVGTLEPGKWADFVALAADPLVDIRNTRTIDSGWIAGNRVAR